MEWIPVRDLHTHPAVLTMAEQLKIEPYAVVGRLVQLWVWATEHSTDGKLRGITDAWVDNFVQLSGFTLAMKTVRWLQPIDGGIQLLKWERWLSKSGKARVLAAQRQRRKRSRSGRADVTRVSRAKCDDRQTEQTEQTGQNRQRRGTLNTDSDSEGKASVSNPADAAEWKACRLLLIGNTKAGVEPISLEDWQSMVPLYRIQRILSLCGCDTSYSVAVSCRAAKDSAIMPAVVSTFVRFMNRKQRPNNPGGWTRTVLEKEGVVI